MHEVALAYKETEILLQSYKHHIHRLPLELVRAYQSYGRIGR